MRKILVASAVFFLAPGVVKAQEDLLGQRVRVVYGPGNTKIVGTVVSGRPGTTLRIRVNGSGPLSIEALEFGPSLVEPGESLVSVDRISMHRLERSLGVKGHARRGAAIGGAVGFALGAAVAIAATGDDYSYGWYLLALPIGMWAAGATLGALVGVVRRTERWEPVFLGNLGGRGVPAERGLEISFTKRF